MPLRRNSFEPQKLPENAQTPTIMTPVLFGGRMHTVLGVFSASQLRI